MYAAAYTKCATAHTAGKKRMPMHTQSVPLHTLAQAWRHALLIIPRAGGWEKTKFVVHLHLQPNFAHDINVHMFKQSTHSHVWKEVHEIQRRTLMKKTFRKTSGNTVSGWRNTWPKIKVRPSRWKVTLFLVCVSSEMFLHIISLSKIIAKAFGKSHHSYLQNTSTKYFCQLVLSTKCII